MNSTEPTAPSAATCTGQANLDPRPRQESRAELAIVFESWDVNAYGKVHGGKLFEALDNAAWVAARRHAGGPLVTAAVHELSFLHPVRPGDLFAVAATLDSVGRSSLEISVHATVSAPSLEESEPIPAVSAQFVFVALDGDNQPRRVPRLVIEEPGDALREQATAARREHRARLRRMLRPGAKSIDCANSNKGI
jgi:acyl-CoA hydrolase